MHRVTWRTGCGGRAWVQTWRGSMAPRLGPLISALACAFPLAGTYGIGAELSARPEAGSVATPVPSDPLAHWTGEQPDGRVLARDRLRQALETGFGVQYWGDSYEVAGLEAAGHGLLIVEATRVGAPDSPDGAERRFTSEEVRRISRDGTRPVLAYLNLTEIETYRDYWVRHLRGPGMPDAVLSAPWIGPQTESGEQLATYWHPIWATILAARVERLMALGFDGILFDDAMHYFSFQSEEGLRWPKAAAAAPADGHAMALMRLVLQLTDAMRAANPAGIAVVNNGVFVARDAAAKAGLQRSRPLFERYAAALDGLLIESLFAPGAMDTARRAAKEDFAARGISVMTIDFLTDFDAKSQATARAELIRRAVETGFCPYVAPDGRFDRLAPPVRCNGI